MTEPQPLSSEQFIRRARKLLDRGYFPLPVGRLNVKRGQFKNPWIDGHHGFNAKQATKKDISAWPSLVSNRIANGQQGILSLGIVLPPNVLAMDVDAYDGKHGLDSLSEWVSDFGPLPETYMITARDDGSGIRLYRKPIDYYPQEVRNSGVDWIDQNHRFIIAPGSWHHTGQRCCLIVPGTRERKMWMPPPVNDLPEFPESYLAGLRTNPNGHGAGSFADIEMFLDSHTEAKAPGTIKGVESLWNRVFSEDGPHEALKHAADMGFNDAAAGNLSARTVYKLLAELWKSTDRPIREFDDYICWQVIRSESLDRANTSAKAVRDYGTDTRNAMSTSTDDDDPFSEDDDDSTLEPTNYEVREAARKIMVRRAADQLVREVEAEHLLEQSRVQSFNGVAFLEDIQPGEPVWGTGKTVAWAKSQGFMVFGTDGTGKSTLLQQIMMARLGLRDSDVLGFPVTEDERSVLYLALDRPVQIRESIARMVDLTNADAYDTLKSRLTVVKGPVPFQCDSNPRAFFEWCMSLAGQDCGMVIVDSVKDMVSSCVDDAAGAGFNDTMQQFIAKGIDFGCAHHNRKANAKPRALADVYGSRWLTAGMGAVLNIWRNDDNSRELTQLKTPYGNAFRPVEYTDDYASGQSKVADDWQSALVSHLATAGRAGLTDAECVLKVFGQSARTAGYEANRQKITRRIDRWIKEGHTGYQRVDAMRNGSKCKVWRLVVDGEDTSDVATGPTTEERKRAAQRVKDEIAAIDQKIIELDNETK